MELAIDLHSHSGYAGGVGQIELSAVSQTMKQKGINVFGTGDCLYPTRTRELQKALIETSNGLFSLPGDSSRFLLQTEVILSTKLDHKRKKTIAHHLIFFPDFVSIEKMRKLMDKWGMKNTIGRPFIVSNEQAELEGQLFEIQNIHPLIEIVPAHVMTPDGIYGSKNNLEELAEFYGNFLPHIRVIETGLSADPSMLEQIPDLAELTYISNSDCHSAALNRIGREFTIIESESEDYPGIINALRKNKVVMTAEFNPAEGRYFLTGHRANRAGHSEAVIYHDVAPEDLICPVCGKKMLLGVNQRCLHLQDEAIEPVSRKYLHLIPLVEVIAFSLGVKSVTSRKVVNTFHEIMAVFPSEIALWQSDNIEAKLAGKVDAEVIHNLQAVKADRFRFDPPGFDGEYGILKIG